MRIMACLSQLECYSKSAVITLARLARDAEGRKSISYSIVFSIDVMKQPLIREWLLSALISVIMSFNIVEQSFNQGRSMVTMKKVSSVDKLFR